MFNFRAGRGDGAGGWGVGQALTAPRGRFSSLLGLAESDSFTALPGRGSQSPGSPLAGWHGGRPLGTDTVSADNIVLHGLCMFIFTSAF